MQGKPIYTLLATIAAIIVIGGAFYFTRPHAALAPTGDTVTTTPSDTATSTVSGSGNNGGVAKVSLAQPSMGPIQFDSSLNLDIAVQTQLLSQLSALKTEIGKNPLELRAWINLGAVYKLGGDYKDAEIAWNYVLSVTPKDVTANYNLGDLYQNYLKDYPKAEQSYLTVIERKPDDVETYVNLYTMYRYQWPKSDAKAAAIISQGLKANPGNERLLSLQQELQGSGTGA